VKANGSGSILARASISNEPSKDLSARSFFGLAAAGEAGLLLLAWGLSRWLDVSPLQQIRLTVPSILWGGLATLPLLLGLAWMLASAIAPIRRLVTLVVEQVGAQVAACTTLQLGCLAAVAGLSEEVLFRGVIQVGLTRWLSVPAALLAASVLFGLVHSASRMYALFAALMGLYLGALFLLQGSLVAPIVAHSVYDFVALGAVARRYRRGRG
jgi:membrane protease YdiL (CAAX protease family)